MTAVRADLYPSGLSAASIVREESSTSLPRLKELYKGLPVLGDKLELVPCTPLTHLPVHLHVHCGHHLHKVLEHHGGCVEKKTQGMAAARHAGF